MTQYFLGIYGTSKCPNHSLWRIPDNTECGEIWRLEIWSLILPEAAEENKRKKGNSQSGYSENDQDKVRRKETSDRVMP